MQNFQIMKTEVNCKYVYMKKINGCFCEQECAKTIFVLSTNFFLIELNFLPPLNQSPGSAPRSREELDAHNLIPQVEMRT